MAEMSASSAAYRERLGNIDATVDTANRVSRMDWKIWLVILVLVALIALAAWLAAKKIAAWAEGLKEKVSYDLTAGQEEQRTGQNAQLDRTQLERKAGAIYGSFHWTGDNEEAIKNAVLSLNTATDWNLLVEVFGRRRCKYPWNGDESLQEMFTRHLAESVLLPMRSHLVSIGVRDPGF